MTAVLVLAAGSSRRYAEAGIATPKGLIRFRWRHSAPHTMIEHIAGMDHRLGQENIVVGTGQGPEWEGLPYPRYGLPPTRGQADTAARLVRGLELENVPLLVLNSDAGFLYPLNTFVRQSMPFDAAALVFPSEDRSYSYVQSMPLFHLAREKSPISRWAMAGAYFFRRGRLLAEAVERQMRANQVHDNGEFYLSGTFVHLETDGSGCLAVPMDREQWLPWGTPEDLARDPRVLVEDPAVEAVLKRMR